MSRFPGRAAGRAGWIVLVVGLALSALSPQGWHQDERYGFKLLAPRGWKPIPLQAGENWLVAKYLCDEKDHWNDGSGWTWDHQPELMVVAFVDEAIANARKAFEELKTKRQEELAKKKEEQAKAGSGETSPKEGDEGEEVDLEKAMKHLEPYDDYENFLERTHASGGFKVVEREEGTSNDLRVTKLEVDVARAAFHGPKRIVAWVFHTEGVDLALQVEVLASEYPKHKSAIQAVMRSFRAISRTVPLPTGLRALEGGFVSNLAMQRGTLEERTAKRHESELLLHTRAKQVLPDGWKAKEHERFLVLYGTEEAFADEVAASLAALLGWAEQNLGFLGPGEYVRRPILRVCATEEEKRSLQRGAQHSTRWVWDTGHELVTCPDDLGKTGWELDWVNERLIELWLGERDHAVWFGLPTWVRHGLDSYVEGARLSGKKLQFRVDDWERDDFREAVQQKKHAPVRELVKMTSAQFSGRDTDYAGFWDRQAQADMLVRFLLSPEAARSKQTKTLLFDYLARLREVVLELEAEDQAKGGGEEPEPKTEEEEKEYYRRKREAWDASDREKTILERSFQRTFGSWSSADWQTFEKAFLKFAT